MTASEMGQVKELTATVNGLRREIKTELRGINQRLGSIDGSLQHGREMMGKHAERLATLEKGAEDGEKAKSKAVPILCTLLGIVGTVIGSLLVWKLTQ